MGSNESRKDIYQVIQSNFKPHKAQWHNTKTGELCFFSNSFEDDYSSPPSLEELKMNTEVLDQQSWRPNELLVKYRRKYTEKDSLGGCVTNIIVRQIVSTMLHIYRIKQKPWQK